MFYEGSFGSQLLFAVRCKALSVNRRTWRWNEGNTRLCLHCNGGVEETVEHLFLECSKYEDEQEEKTSGMQAGSSSDALTWVVHLHGMTQSGPRGITLDNPGSQEKKVREAILLMESKIKICVVDSLALVWSMQQVQALRKHRVTGIMDGALPDKPLQNRSRGLPMVLLSEAATMLRDMGIVELVFYPALLAAPTVRMELLLSTLEKGDHAKQRNKYYEERKVQINKHASKILQSAKKKNAKLAEGDPNKIPDSELTLEKVISDKLEQISPPKEGSLLSQIHNEYPFMKDLVSEPADWTFPSTEREKRLYYVFKDLWQKNYWIMAGGDCGVDFLAYKGDPILVHATFGVTVVASDCQAAHGPNSPSSSTHRTGLHMSDFTAYVRVNNIQKRNTLIAFVQSDGTVNYQTIKWKGLCFTRTSME
ncbi:tRNA intron endonuclease catalytic domain-like [Trinorchestia longiramus]|nr:tRNA intron endonuclease catalytic domain-like [Trinorchestia longiramus]